MARLIFDGSNPNLTLVRQVIFRRLRDQKDSNLSWRELEDDNARGFEPYVEFPHPYYGANTFAMAVIDVFWQLVSEGILAPGLNASCRDLPWFHVTAYGRKVIEHGEYQPHDRDGYVQRLLRRNPQADATVVAYLEESLETFVRGNRIASMVMLGVAAERVFDLVCQSMVQSLTSQKEKTTLEGHMVRARIKPRIDFVGHKLTAIQQRGISDFPESATLMVTAMYDMIRVQRNELGHPRERPPRLEADEANARLQMFAGYFETAEHVRRFLETNKV
jgi:hypothetical protein